MKDLNLIPQQYLHQKRKRATILYGLIIASMLIIAISIVVMAPFMMIKYRRNQLLDIQEQLNNKKYQQLNKTKQKLREKQVERERLSRLISQMKESSMVSCEMLDVLISALPPETYIKQLSLRDENRTVELQGFAKKRTSISEYVVRLSNTALFTNVQMEVSTKLEEEKNIYIQYKISLRVKGEGKGVVELDEETNQ